MPKFIANAYLLHNGKVVQTGEELELEAKQAKVLGDKVTPAPEEKEPEKEQEPVKEEKPKKETKAKKESK
ncbi:hypothetical protein J22TS1_43790 [Siminovitchia terrae]|uniref:DUF7210 family protein n=1 Tax=Siminovitchia terrae TaxID=1914933 RepID=UPI001AFD21FF|nr:hypothetical protein [Siminovitchia terrae]GIN93328.1 hypothetical protein J22TS1_43790 [Siminovitchia terrae]